MSKKMKFAIILSGAGMRDGSEIHESVLTMLAITNAGGEYICFAPDIALDEVNHSTGQPTGAKRSVMIESARIARGPARNLAEYNPAEFDVLAIVGGAGTIRNLSSFSYDGADCKVNLDVQRAIENTHQQGLPIVALCIAPVVVAKVLGNGVKVTVGDDENLGNTLRKMDATVERTGAKEVTVDRENKVVTTPCYMTARNIGEVAVGITHAIDEAVALA